MRRRSSRTRWTIVALGLISLPCVVGLGLWSYLCWAYNVPPYPLPTAPMPVPNGYDRATVAMKQLPREPRSDDRLRPWSEGPAAQLRGVLRPARPALDLVRATFRMEWRAPLRSDSVPPERRGWVRRCGRYFQAESHLAESEGDSVTAMERSLAEMEIGIKSARGGGHLDGWVGAACESGGMKNAQCLVQKLPAAAIPNVLQRVSRLRQSWPDAGQFLEADREALMVKLTELFTSQRHRLTTPTQALRFFGQEAMDPAGVMDGEGRWERFIFCLTPKERWLQQIDGYYRRMIAESKKPLHQWRVTEVPNDLVSYLMGVSDVKKTQAKLEWVWRVEADLALLEVALAVRMHHLERGRYPERLTDISERWLPTLPALAYRRPIQYRLRDGNPFIYCMDPDGKGQRIFGKLTRSRRP